MNRRHDPDDGRNGSVLRRAGSICTRLLRLVVAAAQCLFEGLPSCEHTFLVGLRRLDAGAGEAFWQWREQIPGGTPLQTLVSGDREHSLRAAQFFAEAALEIGVTTWLDATGRPSLIDRGALESLHADAARQLQQLIEHRSGQRWLQKTAGAVESWEAGVPISVGEHADRPIHLALVASVGRPSYAAKAMAGIRSALFFASEKPLHFHLFVDEAGEKDMERALRNLEPWLRAKGRFEMHGEAFFNTFFASLRTWIPEGCLGYAPHFGDAGWVRIFITEVFRDRPEIEHLIFVDAGDFVFLEDPAKILQERVRFQDAHVLGAPQMCGLALQLFDLPRMRQLGWTKFVTERFRDWHAERGDELCWLGEGGIFIRLVRDHNQLWHHFSAAWCYDPWEFGKPHLGLEDLWIGNTFEGRTYPGVRDWMTIYEDCPTFLESFVSVIFQGDLPPRRNHYLMIEQTAAQSQMNRFGSLVLQDTFGKEFKCNDRYLGVHFSSMLKSLPWARRFLNYWAGAPVWGGDRNDHLNKSLRMA